MSEDIAQDQLAVIKIEGMHCHRCEQSIQKALASHSGVREVEVDFASGQASVLFRRGSVTVKQLMDTINNAGYRATGFTQNRPRRATAAPPDAPSAPAR
ncbi:MAG TPA: heavy metal-associated domain-containing protein [Tepidisphaeraceae bacterium]|jgi:Cu+-exporting ATPase